MVMRRLSLRPIRSLGLAVLLCLLISGCQSLGSGGLMASNAPAEISGAATTSIATDMVSRLAEHVVPGTGTIALKQDGSPFGKAMESALKGWGYAVVTDQKTDGGATLITLAYVVEPFEAQTLVRLSTNSVELGRAYTVTAQGASPASPLSVMRRG
jgi:type IV secretion system protein TrbH